MTDQEINQAIAEELGWEIVGKNKVDELYGWEKGVSHKCSMTHALIPDYVSDLNAMHEAEKTLKDRSTYQTGGKGKYLAILSEVIGTSWDGTWMNDFIVVTATARQRAEAFLRTIGKWK